LNESIDDSKDWKQSVTEIEPVKKRKRRFSADSANDLLFWGCHLAIVAISLGIMWVKFDGTNKALKDLLKAQSHEIDVVKSQALKAEQAAQEARNAEHTRNVQFSAASNTLQSVVEQVGMIQRSVEADLSKAVETNNLVLQAIDIAKAAALKSEIAASEAATKASIAAGAAGSAAGAASRAAATSSRTGTVVASKVVTTQDKRQLETEQRRLALKQQQLRQTIRTVKKQGPTLWQKITQ